MKHLLLPTISALAAVTLSGCGGEESMPEMETKYVDLTFYNKVRNYGRDTDRHVEEFYQFNEMRFKLTENDRTSSATMQAMNEEVRSYFTVDEDPVAETTTWWLGRDDSEFDYTTNWQHIKKFNKELGANLDAGRIWFLVSVGPEDQEVAITHEIFDTDTEEKTMLHFDWRVALEAFNDEVRAHFDVEKNYKLKDIKAFNEAFRCSIDARHFREYHLSHINGLAVNSEGNETLFQTDTNNRTLLTFEIPLSGLHQAVVDAVNDVESNKIQNETNVRMIGENQHLLGEAVAANKLAWDVLGEQDSEVNTASTALGAVRAAKNANLQASNAVNAANDTIKKATDLTTSNTSKMTRIEATHAKLVSDFDSRFGNATTPKTIKYNVEAHDNSIGITTWKEYYGSNRTIANVIGSGNNSFLTSTNTATSVLARNDPILTAPVGYPSRAELIGGDNNFLNSLYGNSISESIGFTPYPATYNEETQEWSSAHDFLDVTNPDNMTITGAINDLAVKVASLTIANITNLKAFISRNSFPSDRTFVEYFSSALSSTTYTLQTAFTPVETFINATNTFFNASSTLHNFLKNDYFTNFAKQSDVDAVTEFLSGFGSNTTLQTWLSNNIATKTSYTEVKNDVVTKTRGKSVIEWLGKEAWPSTLTSTNRTISSAIGEIQKKDITNTQNVGVPGIAKNIRNDGDVAVAIADSFGTPFYQEMFHGVKVDFDNWEDLLRDLDSLNGGAHKYDFDQIFEVAYPSKYSYKQWELRKRVYCDRDKDEECKSDDDCWRPWNINAKCNYHKFSLYDMDGNREWLAQNNSTSNSLGNRQHAKNFFGKTTSEFYYTTSPAMYASNASHNAVKVMLDNVYAFPDIRVDKDYSYILHGTLTREQNREVITRAAKIRVYADRCFRGIRNEFKGCYFKPQTVKGDINDGPVLIVDSKPRMDRALFGNIRYTFQIHGGRNELFIDETASFGAIDIERYSQNIQFEIPYSLMTENNITPMGYTKP